MLALAAAAVTGCATTTTASKQTGSTPTSPTSPTPPPTSPTPPPDPTSLPTEQAARASDFTNSVGVVTHLSYTDTPYYSEFPQVLKSLETLGVHHIRDGFYPWASNSPIVGFHKELAAAGIKCDYVVPYNPATTATAIETLASQTGDMETLEAPNECDVSGECGGTGALGVLDMVSFLPVVDKAAKGLGIPSLGPSFVLQSSFPLVGDLDSLMSVNNLHVYFGGRNPGSAGWGALDAQGDSYGSFGWWLDQAAIDGPGKPVEITETGYIASESTTPYTLPDDVEGSYTPRTLLLAFKHGIARTLLYELLDEKSSPGYGLLHSDFSAKPAFTAVKNLLATLNDEGASGTFSAGSLPFDIEGGGTTLQHLLLEKHDGSYWLVLWLEQSSWDPVHMTPVAVTSRNIGLQLGSAYATTTDYQFDSNGDVTPFHQPMSGDTANLTVTDQVSIVKIVPR